MTNQILTVAGWTLFAMVALGTLPSIFAMLIRRLPDVVSDQGREHPGVSMIFSALNEAAAIEAATRSMLAIDYANLELIAVNDRSTDQTGAILDGLAAEDPRLTVIHINDLPQGWLGKSHALHTAAQRATGEFLLFTDADIVFEPNAIHEAIEYVESRQLDHLCLMPRLIRGGLIEDAAVAFFGYTFCIGTHAWLIPSRFQFAYCGVGAFNLVRTTAYREVDGHEPIRLDILDDVKLGKLLKQSGFRADFVRGEQQVAVRWQTSTGDVIRGLEKNAFASLGYSIFGLTVATIGFIVFFVMPYLVCTIYPDERCFGFVATAVAIHLGYGLVARAAGARWAVIPIMPIAACLMAFAFLRSAWCVLRQGGVRWRDSFYPLDQLRANIFR